MSFLAILCIYIIRHTLTSDHSQISNLIFFTNSFLSRLTEIFKPRTNNVNNNDVLDGKIEKTIKLTLRSRTEQNTFLPHSLFI